MSTPRGGLLVFLFALPLVAGCGGAAEPAANGYVVVADVSRSTQDLGLLDEAKQVLGERVMAMEAPSRVTFLAFNMEVGSSKCPPVKVELAWSENSTEMKDNRASYVEPAQQAVDPYVECALDSFGGTGTDVFGGIAQAASALDGVPGDRTIDVLTDGCHVTAELRTCSPRVADAAWRASALAALPEALKPDLEGVELTFHGVGRGSRLESDAVLGLKDLYTEYANATGATAEFED